MLIYYNDSRMSITGNSHKSGLGAICARIYHDNMDKRLDKIKKNNENSRKQLKKKIKTIF